MHATLGDGVVDAKQLGEAGPDHMYFLVSSSSEICGAFGEEGDDAFSMVRGASGLALAVAFKLHGVLEGGV